jgi:hypothetical protein
MIFTWWVLAALGSAGVSLSADDCPPSLGALIRDELSVAGFSSEGSEVAHIVAHCANGQAEVRIDDRVTQKTVERHFALLTDARAESRLAVQVVELLHASLAEARFTSRPPVPAQVETFLASRAPAPPSAWGATLAGGVVGGLKGLGVQPAVSGALTRRVLAVELGLGVAATVHATTLNSEAGRALFGLVQLEAVVGLPIERGAWCVVPSVGVGALAVWANGEAGKEYEPHFGVAATFAATIGCSVWREVNAWLSVGLNLDVTAAPAPVRIDAVNASASVGLPLASLSLGLRFR